MSSPDAYDAGVACDRANFDCDGTDKMLLARRIRDQNGTLAANGFINNKDTA